MDSQNETPALPWWRFTEPADRLKAINAKAKRGELELKLDDPARLPPPAQPRHRRQAARALRKVDEQIQQAKGRLKELTNKRNLLTNQS